MRTHGTLSGRAGWVYWCGPCSPAGKVRGCKTKKATGVHTECCPLWLGDNAGGRAFPLFILVSFLSSEPSGFLTHIQSRERNLHAPSTARRGCGLISSLNTTLVMWLSSLKISLKQFFKAITSKSLRKRGFLFFEHQPGPNRESFSENLAVVYDTAGERPETMVVLGCLNPEFASVLSSVYKGCGHSSHR